MARVFLSYRKSDRALVERIEDALSRRGCATWWDDDIDPRVDWDEEIEREIDAADFVLVLWTRNSVTSSFVKLEAARAMEAVPSKLLQARFDDCRVPIRFTGRQYVDLDPRRPEESPGWATLMRWLDLAASPAETTEGPPPARPRPAPAVMGVLTAVALPLAIVLSAVQTDVLAEVYWASWLALGAVVAVVAMVAVPERDAGGRLLALLLGVGGALVAGFLGLQVGFYGPGENGGIVVAAVGAVAALSGYRLIARR